MRFLVVSHDATLRTLCLPMKVSCSHQNNYQVQSKVAECVCVSPGSACRATPLGAVPRWLLLSYGSGHGGVVGQVASSFPTRNNPNAAVSHHKGFFTPSITPSTNEWMELPLPMVCAIPKYTHNHYTHLPLHTTNRTTLTPPQVTCHCWRSSTYRWSTQRWSSRGLLDLC